MSHQLILLITLLGLSTVFGIYRSRTDGRIKLTATSKLSSQQSPGNESTSHLSADPSDNGKQTSGEHVQDIKSTFKFGQELGRDVTLVQFSSAFCQPCRATRLLLEDVASSNPGVVHIEIDAESHLDLVRELGVNRTPTTFILNNKGDIVGKTVGLPKRAEVLNVVEAVSARA